MIRKGKRQFLRSAAAAIIERLPASKPILKIGETVLDQVSYGCASLNPRGIRARPLKLTMAITANCNLRCIGCRYGRDFMPGKQLALATVKHVLEDARDAGVEIVRFYGGEPLLHRDLPDMIRHARSVGLKPYVTTNGILLEKRIEELYAAGLRSVTLGYYGHEDEYNAYVQRTGKFDQLVRSLDFVRMNYGNELKIQLNYLVMRPTVSTKCLELAVDLARRFDLTLRTDLIHYSLPYFTDSPDRCLQFAECDRPLLDSFVDRLLQYKSEEPHRFPDTAPVIRSITDWLLKGADMRIPCDAGKLIWIGADGTVQLCYVTFPLGSLNDRRLRDMLFTETHHQAARDAFMLNCPNCHCERGSRMQKHLTTFIRYAV